VLALASETAHSQTYYQGTPSPDPYGASPGAEQNAREAELGSENYVTSQRYQDSNFMPGGVDHPSLSFLNQDYVPQAMKDQAAQAQTTRLAVEHPSA
jgi:hypothetical protein